MSEPLIDVAEAVVVDLNLAPLSNFGFAFTALLSYAEWDLELTDNTLHVDVVPVGYMTSELADRSGQVEHAVAVHIAVRKRLKRATLTKRFVPADVKALITATRKINDFFVLRELTTMASAIWVQVPGESPIESAYDRDHLRLNSQFTGIVKVAYEVTL